jgi:hypothetical protein
MTDSSSTAPNDNPTKEAALRSIEQIFESLASLMMDSGITTYDGCQLLRTATVKAAAKRVRNESGRDSKSRVAAITGLSRSEVSRLWKSDGPTRPKKLVLRPAQRILSTWYNSTQFLASNGEPDVLQIFGGRRSFQRLVKINGAGIPVRAMLDELISLGAVELLPNQRVRAKARIPVQKGFNVESIRSIGERTSDFLGTLTRNLVAETPLFEANTGSIQVNPDAIALIRREVANRSTSFFGSIEQLLKNSQTRPVHRAGPHAPEQKVGIGVFYFEKDSEILPRNSHSVSRKNLRRKNQEKK